MAIVTSVLCGAGVAWVMWGMFSSTNSVLASFGAHMTALEAIAVGIIAGAIAFFRLWPWNKPARKV